MLSHAKDVRRDSIHTCYFMAWCVRRSRCVFTRMQRHVRAIRFANELLYKNAVRTFECICFRFIQTHTRRLAQLLSFCCGIYELDQSSTCTDFFPDPLKTDSQTYPQYWNGWNWHLESSLSLLPSPFGAHEFIYVPQWDFHRFLLLWVRGSTQCWWISIKTTKIQNIYYLIEMRMNKNTSLRIPDWVTYESIIFHYFRSMPSTSDCIL